jgi:hypothetical protein
MTQRGRRSAANLAVLRVDGRPPPLEPPRDLTGDERLLFDEIVSASDTRGLVKTDLPLLVSFVQVTTIARNAARGGKIDVFEKCVRMQAMLATRLRLSPQARITARTAGRQQYTGPKPWDN